MKWFIKGIRNYAVFRGRASRQEFWMFLLFCLLFGIAAALLTELSGRLFPFEGLFVLLVLVPFNAIIVRRLHDVGKSGLWFLGWFLLTHCALLLSGACGFPLSRNAGYPDDPAIILIACFGLLSLGLVIAAVVRFVILLSKPSFAGANKYGPDPNEPLQPHSGMAIADSGA